MDLNTWTTILIAVAPAIAAVCTIIGSFVGLFRVLKKERSQQKAELDQALSKLNKAYKDIANMKTQLASINQYLIDQKENH